MNSVNSKPEESLNRHPAEKNSSSAAQNSAAEEELTGLVLSLQDYRESDGIIRLALQDQVVGVLARGVMKSASRNRRLCNPFSKVRIVYDPKYSHGMYYLIHGEVLWFDSHIQDDLLAQSVCFVLRDLIVRIGINPMIYECLEACWQAWNCSQQESGCLYACLVLAGLLKEAGIAPNVDSCTVCGKTNGIETIVLEEGGFVCKDCAQGKYPRISRKSLLAFRALFRAGSSNIQYLQEHFRYTLQDVLMLSRWWEYHTDSVLPSISFLDTVIHMESGTNRSAGFDRTGSE